MRCIIPIVFACLCVMPAWGSDARIQSLGVQFEYIEDYILFRQFPTVIARYPNLITVSPGGRNLGDHSVGLILAPNSTRRQPFGTWALFLNQDSENDRNAHIEIAWAKSFNALTLGGSFMWFDSEQRVGNSVLSPVDYPANRGQTAFTVGSLVSWGPQTTLESALELAWIHWERTRIPFQENRKSAGKASYRLSSRLVRSMGPETQVVPLFHYVHQDLTEETASGDSFTNSGNLGVGFRHQVHGTDMILGGVAVNYFKSQRQTSLGVATLERWDLPAMFLSMEVELASWLVARAGATKTLDISRDESFQAETTETLESRYFFGLGVGIHIRDLMIDARVNPDALYSGGYFLSGEQTRLFTRVTLTYPF